MMMDCGCELVSFDAATANVRAVVRMPREFVGFEGHFPGEAILPGFVHVQVAVELLARVRAGAVLTGVESAKFTRAILPGEEIVVELVRAGEGREGLGYEAMLRVGGEVCSRFRMRVRQEGAAGGR
jgi:3-hydroxyacyl-[acyl-carrier-protein] dehydratase